MNEDLRSKIKSLYIFIGLILVFCFGGTYRFKLLEFNLNPKQIPTIKDLLKLTVVSNPDGSLQINERYKTRLGEPEKKIDLTLPKDESSNEYTAQLIDDGEGYVTMKTYQSNGCWMDSDITLAKHFIKDDYLVKKTLHFQKDRDGCVKGSRYYLFVLKDDNWLICLTDKGIEEGNYSYPGKNSVYDLSDLEPLDEITKKEWSSTVKSNNVISFDVWVKEQAKL